MHVLNDDKNTITYESIYSVNTYIGINIVQHVPCTGYTIFHSISRYSCIALSVRYCGFLLINKDLNILILLSFLFYTIYNLFVSDFCVRNSCTVTKFYMFRISSHTVLQYKNKELINTICIITELSINYFNSIFWDVS